MSQKKQRLGCEQDVILQTPDVTNQCTLSIDRDSNINNGDSIINICNTLPNNNIVAPGVSYHDSVNNREPLRRTLRNIQDKSVASSQLHSKDEDPLESEQEYMPDSPAVVAHSQEENIFNSEEVSDKTDESVNFSALVECRESNGAVEKTIKVRSKKRRGSKSSGAGRGPGRGRPRKALVAMYHSQISGDKNTIKIRIKKSNLSAHVQLTPNKKKTGRRKKHRTNSDADLSDLEHECSTKRTKIALYNSQLDHTEPHEQSNWGSILPENILNIIFNQVIIQEGALPTLVRLCRVCKLWRDVATSPSLWVRVDLSRWVKEKFRTDLKLHWLIRNRLSECQDLNLGEWKVSNIQPALEALRENCPELKGLNFSGWKGLNSDNLNYITTEFTQLERLDLSSINPTTAINAQPLINLGQTMNSRLTHLVLAHNKIASFTLVMASIAGNCPNLELLDISNIKTFAHNTALLHIEKVQIGCPKLRILRLTSSQIWLAPATLAEQVASPGFPCLEELSLAGVEDDQTTTARCVDDDGFERILKNSTKLRLLDVRGCIRLTDSVLVKVPAWDLEHLFLSSCCITRTQNSRLELMVQKWSHSLLEIDLGWSTATDSLDAAVLAFAEKGSESPIETINLCGSSVSLDPIKAILAKCPTIRSINLQSCRALPRGIKRLYTGPAVQELRQSLEDKPKTEESPNSVSDPDQPTPD